MGGIMQFIGEKAVIQQNRKKTLVSIPDSLCDNKVFCKEAEVEFCGYSDENALAELWNNQHPLIHTWLILTSVSIFLLSAFLFVIQ